MYIHMKHVPTCLCGMLVVKHLHTGLVFRPVGQPMILQGSIEVSCHITAVCWLDGFLVIFVSLHRVSLCNPMWPFD
jgi:hypothetical protein